MALYHKYRPQQFSELVGQEHVRKILQEAISQDKTSHGYLFAGPRGLGKTTTARLLAKALNCTGSGQICNQCASCLQIQDGQSLDVIEIDAASNRGIDEIRELREKIKFLPTTNRYKIFIIDEVHMLTKEAFNALLKTLEEPPRHAVFVLATTEPHKVPATIISRVQRFDFRRPTLQELADWLTSVAKKEKIDIDKPAVLEIARLSEGSFRDAITLLEQVMTYSDKITAEIVVKVLGLPTGQSLDRLISAILACDTKIALTKIEEFYKNGTDFGYLYRQLVIRVRDLMIEQMQPNYSALLQRLLYANDQAKLAPLPQIPLEIALVEWCQSQKLDTSPKEYPASEILPSVPAKDAPSKVQGRTPISDRKWGQIIEAVKSYNHSLAGILKQGKLLGIEHNQLTMAVKFAFHKDRIEEPRNHANIARVISQILDHSVKVVCVVDETLTTPAVVGETLYDEAIEVFGE